MFYVFRLRRIALVLALSAAGWLFAEYVARPIAAHVTGAAKERKVPIYKVERDDRKVAISLDATWGVERTDELLDILDRHGVKTTFFLAGYWAEKHPDYVRKIAERGHEIGNHSYQHPHMNALTREQILADLKKNHDLLKEITGKDAFLFRPPFGEYSDKVIEAAEELGYFTIQWSIDSLDWKDVSASFMVNRVLSAVGPGDIVLFHNAGKHTPEAIDTLIPRLKERGFEVVPISELIYREDYLIESHSGVQRRKTSPPPEPNAAIGAPLAAAQAVGPSTAPDGGAGPPGGATAPRESEAPGAGALSAFPMDRPVREVPGRAGRMAFTVNVDWGNEVLPDMLDVFDRYGVKATFFLTGRWAKAYPEMAAEIARRGHEIGNHGLAHAHPTQLSPGELKEHIAGNVEVLRAAAGVEPVPLYAPPYGEHDERVVREAALLGHWTTLWTLDTIDWQNPSPDTIYRRIVPRAAAGAIVLMHPKPQTVEALPRLIEGLNERGYALVPLYRLMQGAADA